MNSFGVTCIVLMPGRDVPSPGQSVRYVLAVGVLVVTSTRTDCTPDAGMPPTPSTWNVVVLAGPRTPAATPTPVVVLSTRASPLGMGT
jgi:hypothetical protein